MKWLKDEMEDYFYMKKIYQLSHYLGIMYKKEWCEDLRLACDFKNPFDEFDGLRDYILMYYFIDFYESFSRFISIFIKRIWKKKAGHTWWSYYSPEDIYSLWQENQEINGKKEKRYVVPIIKNNVYFYKNLRNVIAHATITIKNKEIKIKEKKKGMNGSEQALRKKLEQEGGFKDCVSKMKNFLYVAIVFTTEFDIRMLKLLMETIEEKDERAYSMYRDYFEVYWDAWNELQEDR